ncbi:unnamed protein product, partial [Nesidiocoris tenuis]
MLVQHEALGHEGCWVMMLKRNLMYLFSATAIRGFNDNTCRKERFEDEKLKARLYSVGEFSGGGPELARGDMEERKSQL